MANVMEMPSSPTTKSSWDDEKASGLLDSTGKYLPYRFCIKKQYYSIQAPYNAHVTFSLPTVSHTSVVSCKKGTK